MPIDKHKVEEAHNYIRAFYKGRIKSANKMYADAKSNASLGEALRRKHAVRNANMASALELLPVQRRFLDKATLYDYANHLVDAREEARPVVGNCFEMALLAAFYVWEMKVGTAWLAGVSESGDHSFCIVAGDTEPAWKKVAAFSDDKSDACVIDPWANVCCRLRDYESQFARKMEAWTSQGKRILKRNDFGYDWVVPGSDDYLAGIAGGELTYVKFGKASSIPASKGDSSLDKKAD